MRTTRQRLPFNKLIFLQDHVLLKRDEEQEVEVQAEEMIENVLGIMTETEIEEIVTIVPIEIIEGLILEIKMHHLRKGREIPLLLVNHRHLTILRRS